MDSGQNSTLCTGGMHPFCTSYHIINKIYLDHYCQNSLVHIILYNKTYSKSAYKGTATGVPKGHQSKAMEVLMHAKYRHLEAEGTCADTHSRNYF